MARVFTSVAFEPLTGQLLVTSTTASDHIEPRCKHCGVLLLRVRFPATQGLPQRWASTCPNGVCPAKGRTP